MTTHDGLSFDFPASSSDRWTNDNIIHGVIEEATYGRHFPGIVVDIGANIGAFTCLAAREASHVYAFEPASLNYPYLLANVERNGFTNVTCRRVGLGSGRQKLYLNPINCGAFSTFDHYNGNAGHEEIECITLDEMLSPLERVDWLKMDCEGAEWDGLLFASNETLAKLHNIVMELHFHAPEHNKNVMTSFLKNEGYNVKFIPAHVPTAVTVIATRI